MKECDMSTPTVNLPDTPTIPLTEYSAYRELALEVLTSTQAPQGLPDFFAPKPMSGSVSSSTF